MVAPERKGRISNYLKDVLQEYNVGNVHSCFQTSFNFQWGDRLIHVGCPDRPLCCFGMELPEKMIGRMLQSIEQGDFVSYKNGKIVLYGKRDIFTIYTDQMETIDLKFVGKKWISDGALSSDTNYLKDSFLWQKLQKMKLKEQIGIEQDEKFKACCHSLENEGASADVVSWLIGRGRGLTPSGDDILLGYGVGLLALDPKGEGEKFLKILSEYIHKQTTDVSLAYYKGLMEGYVNENMMYLLQALKSNNEEETERWLESVRKVGHTSGSDTLLGLRLAVASKVKEKERINK